MRVDRCLCHGTTFAALAEAARASGATTLPEVQAHADFGYGCGLCHPYVRRMLRTGQTAFHEIVTEDDEPAVSESVGRSVGAPDPPRRRGGGTDWTPTH